MKGRSYKLINWWLSRYGNEYLLHGNIAAENEVPGCFKYELVETSRVLRASIESDYFIFKTLNNEYICHISDCLAEHFEWLSDARIWEETLDDIKVFFFKNMINDFRQKRAFQEEQALEREWLDGVTDHIILTMSDEEDYLLEQAVYETNNGYDYPMLAIVDDARVKLVLDEKTYNTRVSCH